MKFEHRTSDNVSDLDAPDSYELIDKEMCSVDQSARTHLKKANSAIQPAPYVLERPQSTRRLGEGNILSSITSQLGLGANDTEIENMRRDLVVASHEAFGKMLAL